MEDHEFDAVIQALVPRAEAETEALLSTLVAGAWPSGPADITKPRSREWVRRWGPVLVEHAGGGCLCEQGRCAVCN